MSRLQCRMLNQQVFGALAEYAFILRQIIHVSRSRKKSHDEAEDYSLSPGAVCSPTRAGVMTAVANPGSSGAPAVVTVSYPNGDGGNVDFGGAGGDTLVNSSGGGGIAFKLNGGMEMRAAAQRMENEENDHETSSFIRGGGESSDPCVSGTSPRFRHPLVRGSLKAEYSSEACLGGGSMPAHSSLSSSSHQHHHRHAQQHKHHHQHKAASVFHLDQQQQQQQQQHGSMVVLVCVLLIVINVP